MSNLITQIHQVNHYLRKAIEDNTDMETGEISEHGFNQIQSLEIENAELTKSLIGYYRECNNNINVIDAEIKRLQDLKKKFNNQTESIERYVKKSVVQEGEKLQTPEFTISYRKSDSLEVGEVDFDVIEMLYPELVRTKKEIDKTAAKKMIKDTGVSIPGIYLVTKNNLSIK